MDDLKREIYIFDIDGSIMPSIFKNFNTGEKRKNIIREAIKNGNQAGLYPKFIDFYKKNCIRAESIYFLTGRRYKEFGKLTENQLQILIEFRDFRMIYYPERKPYKSHKYFAWKAREIKKIIKKSIKSGKTHGDVKENFVFYIFDDLNDHFPRIRDFEDKYKVKIHLTLIDNTDIWNNML